MTAVAVEDDASPFSSSLLDASAWKSFVQFILLHEYHYHLVFPYLSSDILPLTKTALGVTKGEGAPGPARAPDVIVLVTKDYSFIT